MSCCRFQKLSKGVYPLGIKQLNLPKDDYDARIKKAVNRLVKFEKKLMGPTGNDKKRKKKDHNDDVDATKIKKKVQNQSKKDDEQLEEIDEEELDKFIKKSEAKISKARKYEKNYQIGTPLRKKTSIQKAKHRITKKRSLAQKAEFIFKRNSGIWFVFKEGGGKFILKTATVVQCLDINHCFFLQKPLLLLLLLLMMQQKKATLSSTFPMQTWVIFWRQNLM